MWGVFFRGREREHPDGADVRGQALEPFGWNYKPAEKHCWLIFCERKILFRLKKQAE
jgi:hypothetical protein